MIKRDKLKQYRLEVEPDGQGGFVPATLTFVADYDANVSISHNSISMNYSELLQYGLHDEVILHAVTNKALDEDTMMRYLFKGKYYQLRRQQKSGNEWFSVLIETPT